MENVTGARPKILYFVTEDWYFWSHRLPLAVAAKAAGFEVAVVTRVRDYGELIIAQNLKLIAIELSRGRGSFFQEFRLLWRLIEIYREERPTLVHHVALKAVMFGALAARFAKIPIMVNALTGLGYLFINDNKKAKLMRAIAKMAFRLLLNRKSDKVIVQNPDDAALLSRSQTIALARIALIRGSGVDTKVFYPNPEKVGKPIVVLASRMLWEKGVGEFVQAARTLRREGIEARFVLVGDPDPENPGSICLNQLNTWNQNGDIEWWGHRDNIVEVFRLSHIVCLPSYREGVPKVLIEAASCGRPIVTTNVPGCREIVRDEDNGLLIPPKDSEALVVALRRLINDADLRVRLGKRGRAIVESEFSVEIVVRETLAIYQELMR